MQIRSKRGITYKIQKNAKISESDQNSTEKREKQMKLEKIKSIKI